MYRITSLKIPGSNGICGVAIFFQTIHEFCTNNRIFMRKFVLVRESVNTG